MIEVREYQKPEQRTYTSPDIFLAVDDESQIGLRVINGRAEMVAWSSQRCQYDNAAFYSKHFNVKILEQLIQAYNNRDKQ